MNLAAVVIALTFLAASVSAIGIGAPDRQRELLGKMVGHWVLKGIVAKQQTTHDVIAKWVLNDEYIQIEETSREKDAEGHPQYEAIVYIAWDSKIKEYACLWLDTTGVTTFPPEGIGRGKPSGDDIVMIWSDPKDSSGIHTTFAYDRSNDSWSWNIDNVFGGKPKPFARLTLSRVP